MRLRPVVYMRWAKELGLEEGIHNLAKGGIYGFLDEGDLQLVSRDLQLWSRHTDGYPPLKDAIAARYEVGPEEVLTAEGTSLANFLVLAATVRPGDAVLLEDPFYEPLGSVLEALEARIVRVAVDTADGHAAILDVLSDPARPRFRAVVVTNPHNPTGVVLDEKLLEAIAERCARQDALLLVDEAYRELLMEDPPGCARHRGSHVAVTSSLNKSFGLGSLRIGWAIAPPELVQRAILIHDNLGLYHPTLIESLGAQILADRPRLEAWRKGIRSRVEVNRRALQAFLSEETRFELASLPPGILAFPRWKGRHPAADVDTLCEMARKRARLAMVPGRFFGRPDHLRLGIGGPEKETVRSLEVLRDFLGTASDGESEEEGRSV